MSTTNKDDQKSPPPSPPSPAPMFSPSPAPMFSPSSSNTTSPESMKKIYLILGIVAVVLFILLVIYISTRSSTPVAATYGGKRNSMKRGRGRGRGGEGYPYNRIGGKKMSGGCGCSAAVQGY